MLYFQVVLVGMRMQIRSQAMWAVTLSVKNGTSESAGTLKLIKQCLVGCQIAHASVGFSSLTGDLPLTGRIFGGGVATPHSP